MRSSNAEELSPQAQDVDLEAGLDEAEDGEALYDDVRI